MKREEFIDWMDNTSCYEKDGRCKEEEMKEVELIKYFKNLLEK